VVRFPGAADSSSARGYQGTVVGGRVRVGDAVSVLPAGLTAKIAAIVTADGALPEANVDMAVTLRLDRDIDISRGDLIASADTVPAVTQDLAAEICWFDAERLDPSRAYLLKHATATVKAKVAAVDHRIDVDTAQPVPATEPLAMNDIARVRVRTQRPLGIDAYTRNRVTGAFILIDPTSYRTVAAGTLA
jgi:sulfate adenylyltransferase subunit 1 (EFTu-like GTPase family)